MMELPKPPTVRAQEIILAQMERLDKLAESLSENAVECVIDLTATSKAMVELNRELYREYPAPIYPPPFRYPQSAD